MFAGCGKRGASVEFVEGVVLVDGDPVAGATVFFSPVANAGGSSGLPAAGRTGTDGKFLLNATAGARPGAGTAVGEYVVTVVKRESDPVPEPDASGRLPPQPPEVEVRDVLPRRYSIEATSPLRAEVCKGANKFLFELTSDSKKKAK
jgi:hypothetical protein